MTRTIDVKFDGGVLRPVQPLELRTDRNYAIMILDLDEADDAKLTPHQSNNADAQKEIVASAWQIYNERLKAILEPDYLGKVVAIHPDSLEYEVASNSPTARRELRKRRPDGPIVSIRIGVVAADNPLSLRSRNALRGLKS